MPELKEVLRRIRFTDDAGVQRQLVDQTLKVKTNLAGVRHKVLVMSGKGGVGKSAVAVSLGLALARRGKKVGILDADLNGPSVPHMLGMTGTRWETRREGGGGKWEPVIGPAGLRVASMSFFLQEGEPVRWDGTMDTSPVWLGMLEAGVIREFLGDVDWGELDFLILDLPPGAAADKPPAILQHMPEMDGAIFVATPSAVANSVVARSRKYARDLGIRPLGTVVNLAGLFPSEKAAGREETSEEESLRAEIPFDPEFAKSLDAGRPLPPDHPVSRRFAALADRLLSLLEPA